MSVQKLNTKNKSKFSDRIELLCQVKNIEFAILDKDEKSYDDIDALILFHEDHNFDVLGNELRDVFEKKLRPIHKIDINGTKQVIVSHFQLWMERNHVKSPLLFGTDLLVENPKLDGLLEEMI